MAKAVIKTVQQEDRLTSNLILIQKGTFNRFGIGGVPKGHEGRKEHGQYYGCRKPDHESGVHDVSPRPVEQPSAAP